MWFLISPFYVMTTFFCVLKDFWIVKKKEGMLLLLKTKILFGQSRVLIVHNIWNNVEMITAFNFEEVE